MAEFERMMRAFMAKRGLKNTRQLWLKLHEEGYDFTYDRVRRYVKGPWVRRGRPPELNVAVVDALDLSESEITELARVNVGL